MEDLIAVAAMLALVVFLVFVVWLGLAVCRGISKAHTPPHDYPTDVHFVTWEDIVQINMLEGESGFTTPGWYYWIGEAIVGPFHTYSAAHDDFIWAGQMALINQQCLRPK